MNNERYKQLMNDVGLPNSLSLLTALRQVENEVSQPLLAENERLRNLLTMCAELVREEANTHDDDCDCDYCEAVAALEQKL